MVNVLIIGGSTSNESDTEKLAEILTTNSFFDDWAIVIVIHNLYPLVPNRQSNHQNQGIREIFGVKDNLITLENFNPGELLQNNCIYILGSSDLSHPNDSVEFEVYEENGGIFITVENVNQISLESLNDSENEQEPEEDLEENWVTDFPEINDFIHKFLEIENIKKIKLAGVILAGLGNDGAEGLLRIKQEGGKTAVQNPEDCQRPGRGNGVNREMPEAALERLNRFNEENNQNLAQHDLITLRTQGTEEIPTFVEWFSSLNFNT